jgi:hypothetical protein
MPQRSRTSEFFRIDRERDFGKRRQDQKSLLHQRACPALKRHQLQTRAACRTTHRGRQPMSGGMTTRQRWMPQSGVHNSLVMGC